VVRRAEWPRSDQSAGVLEQKPATLWMRVVSMASSSDMGGKSGECISRTSSCTRRAVR
jgi:hypothetical protein